MKRRNNSILYCCSIIALCFLWTSCGYLSWLYRLLEYTTPDKADLLSEVVGYLFQAAGILAVSFLIKNNKHHKDYKKHFIIVIIIDALFIGLSATSNNLTTALIFGYIMNFLHGAVAAFYLYDLTTGLEWNKRGIAFGLGYGIASVVSWLITKIGTGNFLTTNYVLIAYVILVVITIVLVQYNKIGTADSDCAPCNKVSGQTVQPSTIAIVIFTVIILTTTRGIGFYFPTADLSLGINLEFSRAFYAIGLILAGIICDRKRTYGAILSVTALICPFIMFALSGEVGSSIVFWILGYILFGFLNVYRIVIFSDIAASDKGMLWMSAFGLLFGRIGDACGSLIGISLSAHRTALVIVTAVLFVIVAGSFFVLYNRLYANAATVRENEDDKLFSFMNTYDISSREAEVLGLVLSGLSNSEISSKLNISENTVKFHVRNILKKTDCANRKEITILYNGRKNIE